MFDPVLHHVADGEDVVVVFVDDVRRKFEGRFVAVRSTLSFSISLSIALILPAFIAHLRFLQQIYNFFFISSSISRYRAKALLPSLFFDLLIQVAYKGSSRSKRSEFLRSFYCCMLSQRRPCRPVCGKSSKLVCTMKKT